LEGLTEIEIEFAKLRDTIHLNQLARIDAEIQLCEDDTHPDLAKIIAKLDEEKDSRLALIDAHIKLRTESINEQTRSGRLSIHQQFKRLRSDFRERMLLEATSKWYKITRERRALDIIVPDFAYKVP
ncbi:hypothetical protein CANCADRAFT_18899, partial [Tortispora caseinolytica NRRL Y-17796]